MTDEAANTEHAGTAQSGTAPGRYVLSPEQIKELLIITAEREAADTAAKMLVKALAHETADKITALKKREDAVSMAICDATGWDGIHLTIEKDGTTGYAEPAKTEVPDFLSGLAQVIAGADPVDVCQCPKCAEARAARAN